MTSPEQEQFLLLAREIELAQEALYGKDGLQERLTAAMAALGMNAFVQDPDSGVVYQVVKPNGQFVYYKDIDYIRTKKEGERAGSLSLKKAEEAGFVVGK